MLLCKYYNIEFRTLQALLRVPDNKGILDSGMKVVSAAGTGCGYVLLEAVA